MLKKMMQWDKIDFLSPSISLYFNSKKTHTSKISGFLVIIMISLGASYSFILLYNVLNHLNVISLIYKKFEWEAGYYPMNSNNLFYFFQIFSSENGGYFDKFDFKYIRVYTTYVHNNLEQSQLKYYDHWVFDECREDIDNKDINKDLFENIVNFTNSACLRYYYNSDEKKYYSLEEKEFIWPHLEHGISRRDNVFLTTILEKCSNDSVITNLLGNCTTSENIEEYIKKYFGFYMYLLDNSIDPTNYTNPIQNYFQIISTGIGNSKTFVENYMHFAPVRMRTKVGEIFSTYSDINSFFFDFNRKGTAESLNRILLKNYYLMQNNINIYERRYDGVLDILSNIGGIAQLLFYIFYTFNYIYYKYIIIMDTNHFFCKIERASQSDKNTKETFANLKISLIQNKSKLKPIRESVFSLNYNVKNLLDIKINENKSECVAKKDKIISILHNNNKVKKNNFLKNISNHFKKNEENKYKDSPSISNESFDCSNKPINNINQKRLDSLDLLKGKNINTTKNNNELNSNINYIQKKKKTIKNNDNISVTPKKQKSVHFKENFKNEIKIVKKNKNFPHSTINPTLDLNNINEILGVQKLNKDMVKKSNYFEKQFSFFYYIFCAFFKNKRKEEIKNLYSLISFRKKILSENFIFHQHIINLLLGKKCGINHHEIKYLM